MAAATTSQRRSDSAIQQLSASAERPSRLGSSQEERWIESSEDDEALLQALDELESGGGLGAPGKEVEDEDDGIYTPPLPSQARQPTTVVQRNADNIDNARMRSSSPGPEPSPKKKRRVQWADSDDIIEPALGGPTDTLEDAASTSLPEPLDVNEGHGEDGFEEDAVRGDDKGESAASKKAKEKDYLESEIYNPIAYGDMRSYLKYKRAKLKVQEAALLQEEAELMQVDDAAESLLDGSDQPVAADGKKSDIFKGCCVYINGQTHPPYSELRRLLVLHGGQHMAYLDQKRPCTHIVASNLTPKKRIEFKDYKVVLPGWILESIEMGKRADWRKWRCDATTGSNGHVGGNLLASQRLDVSGWRDLAVQARSGKALPRFGEAVESPWGRPSNQKTLLQGFMQPRQETKQLQPSSREGSADKGAQRQSSPDRGVAKGEEIDEVERPNSPKTATSVPRERVAPTMPDTASTSSRPGSLVSPGDAGAKTERTNMPATDDLGALRSTALQATAMTDVQPAKTTAGAIASPSKAVTMPTAEQATPDAAPRTPSKAKSPTKVDYSIGTDPRTKAAATAAGQGDITMKSGYASRPSNTHAARLLASPSWRERNTATSEGFLAGYFAKSRLHHLSTWKTSLQDMVSSALREAGRQPGSLDLPKGVQRVIMHIDFDSFFVSVGLRKRPELKESPVVVCHGSGSGLPPAAEGSEKRPADNQSSSTSEIASCNYVARKFGVRNGMSLGQAKKLCPQVQTIPYDFKAYNDISLAFYAFLLDHVDALQAVSVDEALVDVSMLLENMRNGLYPAGSLYQRYSDRMSSQGDKTEKWSEEKQLAEAFRDEIRELCGCEASIGIGANILLARLATRKAKPGGSFHLTEDMRQTFLDGLDVDDLHGIGWSLRNRLRDLFDTIHVGEIRQATTEKRLMHELGPKKGKVVWEKMHGKDADRLEGNKLRQSVGSHVNYGIRFLTNQEAETFVDGMCQEVSQRARAVRLRGRQVSVQVMVRAKDAPKEAPKFLGHGVCDTHHRSTQVSGPSGCAIDDKDRIKQAAWPLIRDLRADPKELRGIAISLNKLELSDGGSSNTVTPRPQNGQSVLRFDKVSPTKASASTTPARGPYKEGRQPSEEIASDGEQEDEDAGSDLPDLQKGPTAATPRRPVTATRLAQTKLDQPSAEATANKGIDDEIKTPSPPKLPPSTQFAIPSASQLDPTVISALPTPIRQQIYTAMGRAESGDSTAGLAGLQPTPKRLSQNAPRVLPRSTPTTPQKAKLEPSPAMAEALLLPSMSQIDASVLAELPESIRRDILRQTRLGETSVSSVTSSPSTSTPTRRSKKTLADSTLPFLPLGHDNDSESDSGAKKRKASLFRSLSESPRKRTKTKLRDHIGPSTVEVTTQLVDLSTISKQALGELGIDEDVFRALPSELQREMYVYHSEQKASEKKRFKAGSNRSGWEEMTVAERRRRATRRAAELEAEERKARKLPHDADSCLMARPVSRLADDRTKLLESTAPREDHGQPNLRGVTELEQLRPLLAAWFRAFEQCGPRQGDVHRIATFFETCLDPAAPIGSARWDLDKVRSCLLLLRSVIADCLGWDAEVQERARRAVRMRRCGKAVEAGDDGAESVFLRWWIAFHDILARVNERVKTRMDGATLSLD